VQVPLDDVVRTGRFDLAATSARLAERAAADTSRGDYEDAVTSFVFRARRPFHAGRLHAFLSQHFVVQEQDWGAAIAAAAPEHGAARLGQAAGLAEAAATQLATQHGAVRDAAALAAAAARHAARLASSAAASSAGGSASETAQESKPLHAAAAAAATAARRTAFGDIVRSKGFAWLAGPARHDHCATWSSAGSVMQLHTGGPWFGALPLEAWPAEPATREAILADCEPGIADR
jgi:G3E family GTPase